jgi:hypothetical protein
MRNPAQRYSSLLWAVTSAAVILIAVATLLVAPRPALANPEMAKKTGQSCAKCHTAPPALNDYGKKYKAEQKK